MIDLPVIFDPEKGDSSPQDIVRRMNEDALNRTEMVQMVEEFGDFGYDQTPSIQIEPKPPVETKFSTVYSSPRYAWVGSDEREFQILAEKEAIGTILDSELRKLEALQKERRRFVNPPSIDEVVFRLRLEEHEKDLLSALEKYVSFRSSKS